ncbi:MAG: hypothetical protein SPH68_06315 [Candidatus Borkfalkiaceae bacterium]|nr:hypothetical protein [Clostridia bacterium]MDY6223751.1 hypothetical protein [Christensenellaceae bacterium]
MKKKWLALCAALTVAGSVCSFGGCSKAAENTRMTVDINPSVELMVDADNKVVSVTALNDDAAVILQGTAFVGKTSDEAVQAVVQVATETGYIAKGEISADENKVEITVSGDTKWAKDLYKDAEKKVNEFFKESGITGTVERAEALKTDALKELAKNNSVYGEEEIDAMNDEQLLKVIAIGRIETAQLISEDMREAYFAAKEHEISLATSTAAKDVVMAMNDTYKVLYAGFSTALNVYSQTIEALDNMRYNLLVSPDSSYQQLLAQMREKKAEILKQRRIVIKAQAGDSSVTVEAATGDLTALEQAYDALVQQLENAGNAANETLESLITAMKNGEKALKDFQAQLPAEITEQLNAKASEIDAAANEAKNGFFATFEAAHKEDIEKANAALEAAKQKLIASVNEA